MARINDPLMVTTIDLLSAQTLTVSGGATPSATSNPSFVGRLSNLYVFVKNTGASTNCTVDIYGKPAADSTMESFLATFTLGASGAGADKAGRYIEKFPSYIYAKAVNSDATNQAIITVSLDRRR